MSGNVRSRLRETRRRHRSERREDGLSLTEFAIVSGLFLTVLLGIIDFSLTLFDLNSADAGTRDGAHFAAEGVGTDTAKTKDCTITDATFASTDLVGNPLPVAPDNNEARRIICATKSRLGLGATRSRVQLRYEDFNGEPMASGQVTNSGETRFIVICVQIQAQSITGMFRPLMENITLMARGRDQLAFSSAHTFNIPRGGETFFDETKTC